MREGMGPVLVIEYSDPYVPVLRKALGSLGVDFVMGDCFGVSLEDIAHMRPSGIILSAGMCDLDSSGIMADVVRSYWSRIPILGICLGHQVLGCLFGGQLSSLGGGPRGFWDKTWHNGEGIFRGMKMPLNGWRSHSWALDIGSIVDPMRVTALSLGGTVMGIRHANYPLYGVQFHPLGDDGVLQSFLEVCN